MLNNIQIANNNYKEKQTWETISKIKNIIEEIGFDIVEDPANSGVDTYSHALGLYLDGIMITFSYGKGNSAEYARASAYGEMIERLQSDPNRIFRQLYYMYNTNILNTDEFVMYPDDQKETNIEKYMADDRYINTIMEYNTDGIVKKYLDSIVNSQYKTYGYIPLSRFINASTNEETHINEIMYRHMLGSTGYCAGNSKYEALLQGLSEIAERYVKYLIYKHKLCLPLIPDEVLKKSEHSYRVFKELNNSGRYKLEIRDASLGGAYPVVCAILYDRFKRGYVVSLGAFPVFTIALDRTINELLQGEHVQDVRTITGFTSYSAEEELAKKILNDHAGITKNDTLDYSWYASSNKTNAAKFPDEFIGDNFSYAFVEWGDDTLKSNEEMFYETCQTLRDATNSEILYKPYTFLGMPSYSIICPDIAIESFFGLNGHYESNILDRGLIEEALYGGRIDIKKLSELTEPVYADLNAILGRPVKYKNLDDSFFKFYIEFINGNYSLASSYLLNNLPSGKSNNHDRHLDLWKGLSNYVGMLHTTDREGARKILCKIYDEEIVDILHEVCETPEKLGEALFTDSGHEMCVVDFYAYVVTAKAFNILHNKKKEYYEGGREWND